MYLNELVPQYERPSFLVKRRISKTPESVFKMKTKPQATLFNQLFSKVVDFFYLFMETSSIHGLIYITAKNRHILEYLLWLTAVVVAICGAISISLTTWSRYQENPTVVSMERNYKEWNTSFPAVTVCPSAKIGDINIKALFQKESNRTDKKLANNFLNHLANATYETFGSIPKYEQLRASEYLSGVYHSRYDFKYNVSNSNLEIYNVVTMPVTMTEMGICYAYNSAVASYNDPSYWSTGGLTVKKHTSILTGSPLDGDIFAQIMNMNSGYVMYVHSPTETPDAAFRMWKSPNNSYKTLDVSALSIYSTQETYSLSVGQRKCRFLTESNLKISPVYSYNLCRMECRMKLSFSLCKCVPYFYRPLANYKVCNVEGMDCLAKYNDILVKLRYDDSKKVNCPCLPPCDDVNYVTESDNTMDWSLGTNLKWGLVKYPRLRFKRDILFGFSDLLVSIGGTAGFFFGCSVLSVVEIFYFFTLRLMLYAVRKDSK